MNKIKILRIAVQIISFFLISASFFLLSFPLKFINARDFFLSSPSLVAFAALAAQYVILSFLIVLIFVILALVLGRVFCGWVCPYGTVMDCFAFIVKPFKKWRENAPSKMLMSKYVLLVFFLALAVLGFQIVWLFEPITVFNRFLSLSFYPFINASVDKTFQYTIMNYNFGEGIYQFLRVNIFDARQMSFAYSFLFFVFFIIPVLLVLYKRRFWCRYICPLGASLGILSVKPFVKLNLQKCKLHCGKCENMCRVNAIRRDGTYIPSECVMCMDCVTLQCRQIEELKLKSEDNDKNKGVTRKQFIFWGSGVLAALYMAGRKVYASGNSVSSPVIRPPGSISERKFKQACVRCGNCMKVCVTNGLQPVMTETGLDGIWTPQMDNYIGYCEYNCNACGHVCPTQAIEALSMEEKMKRRIGKAEIIKDLCIPWRDGISCLVCEEFCPIPDKAIKFVPEIINGQQVDVPIVDLYLCIGCGVCQNQCPVEGRNRGIMVRPL
ncbi:MAG: 4Fe-4S binding protein [Endomicrobia bacterium]|nr:4Fe-4S binding protein [Endomicrobiia bacterium]MCL2506373.1 4Fe-4S binding protein [Endomicrobiia bacterium]